MTRPREGWRRAFPGAPDQASEARWFVRFLLGSTPFADDAELVVGELVGNAVRHTRSGSPGGHFTVEITLTSPHQEPLRTPAAAVSVLITVYDLGGGGSPRFGDHDQWEDSCEEDGRGLLIVTAVADRVGFQGTPATGHRVWAYLARQPDQETTSAVIANRSHASSAVPANAPTPSSRAGASSASSDAAPTKPATWSRPSPSYRTTTPFTPHEDEMDSRIGPGLRTTIFFVWQRPFISISRTGRIFEAERPVYGNMMWIPPTLCLE
ncbi:hypothetical protein GCM10022226_16970 [Sphaerisporangium flaviroseum]|uniref:Histidine kinase/HSP90-like ATPase domain-containing protein n=1 Tax=Sphaerisporangium flaviroseum TaxID=509199 RepID=A0ABP7HTY1_9ACTN